VPAVQIRRRKLPRLRDPLAPKSEAELAEPEPEPMAVHTTAADWARVLRVTVGVLLVIALIVISVDLHHTLDSNPDASAPQIIQVYTQALFQAVVAIGVAIAVYVLTRGMGD
jgi:hypothetical protein